MGRVPPVRDRDVIRVSEIFGPTIQGEGALIGVPTVFVRTGGCDYRCSWCDSLHAVEAEYRHTWAAMSAADVFREINVLSGNRPLMVSLSGGNPAIQPLGDLITMGHAGGYGFALETQGSKAQAWFADLDMLVLSPKPPSSGMEMDHRALADCVAAARDAPVVLKFVVFDEVDFAFARGISAKYPDLPVYLQPGNHTPPPPEDDRALVDQVGIDDRMRWLVDRAIGDGWFAARVLPQLHVMLWGNRRGI